VLVVKPIIARKHLIKLRRAGGKEVSRRRSPKQRTLLDVFDELVHFTRVFPHRRLTLEVPFSTHQFRSAADLCRMLPNELPKPFHTGHLAAALGVERWIAQRMAYCLRETGAVQSVGKLRGAWLYRSRTPKAA
jgi:hypothetical protein